MTLPVETVRLRTDIGEDLEQVALRMGLDDYDLLVGGYGLSGTMANPTGWFSWAWDRRGRRLDLHRGDRSIWRQDPWVVLPLVLALRAYHQARGTPEGGFHVQVVTDDWGIASGGRIPAQRQGDPSVWEAVDEFERLGYSFRWQYLMRNSTFTCQIIDLLHRGLPQPG